MTSFSDSTASSQTFWRRLRQQDRKNLLWIVGLLLVVVSTVHATLGIPEAGWIFRVAGRQWEAIPQDTRPLVHRILSNLQLPSQESPSGTGTGTDLGAPDVIEYRPYGPQNYSDTWAGFDYALALEQWWSKEDILQCFHKVGPRRRVTFAGDSVMRGMYHRTLKERMESDWADVPDYWPLQRHDALFNVSSALGGSQGDANLVTFSFRFMCNAHPHAEVALRDVLDSDVLVLNSGLWDLTAPGRADLNFARDYMYGLSHLVAFLRAHFHGRVIWRLNPTVDYQSLDEHRKLFYQDSKIRFVNIFAERLMRGAGYEVIDAFSATAGSNLANQGRDDGYHLGHVLTNTLIDLALHQICNPHGTNFGPTTACEVIEAINREGQHNAPWWNGWGLDMSVRDSIPQMQNLVAGHGCSTPGEMAPM